MLCVFAVYLVVGPVEADPEYQLIVDSNNILVEIDNEISKYMMCVCINCVGYNELLYKCMR